MPTLGSVSSKVVNPVCTMIIPAMSTSIPDIINENEMIFVFVVFAILSCSHNISIVPTINTFLISFFSDRIQWHQYEKENDYIHYESTTHFLPTRIRPVPIPYQEQRQEYYRREEDNEPLHWRGFLHPFFYLGLQPPLIHAPYSLLMLISVWAA